MREMIVSFLAGLVLESIYAANVTLISEKRLLASGLSAVLWGVVFLTGLGGSLASSSAGAAWCVGLGIGTVLGMRITNVLRRKVLGQKNDM